MCLAFIDQIRASDLSFSGAWGPFGPEKGNFCLRSLISDRKESSRHSVQNLTNLLFSTFVTLRNW